MNPNLNKSIDAVIIALMIAGAILIGNVMLYSVDKVTARDCERGITSACQYVK